MQYQMYQWMPQGGCAPIGDNTNYGRRTFAAEYLLCMQRSSDATGLWTWRTHTDERRLDSLITFLWYPLELTPVSPLAAKQTAGDCFAFTLPGLLFKLVEKPGPLHGRCVSALDCAFDRAAPVASPVDGGAC